MATNPIQRKARQSFLLGIIITLLLTGIVIYFLYSQVQKSNKQIEELNKKLTEGKTSVYVLNQDVVSGQTLTSDMFMMQEVDVSAIPADATTDIYSLLAAYALCDQDGNTIYTGKDEKGNTYMFTEENGTKKIITTNAESGKLMRDGKEIETSEKPLMSKISLKANTVITGSMIAVADELLTDDVREQTYNMISLPIDLQTGEYVDIRFMLPNGQDFIVLSKQKVTIPDVAGVPLKDTIKLNITEGNLLTLSSAIVEAYQIEGAKLYAIKYVEAGIQDAATETYVPTNDILKQIQRNPNIVSKAMKELKSRWTQTALNFREDNINKADRDEEASKAGIEESTQATQEDREEYLSSIYGS